MGGFEAGVEFCAVCWGVDGFGEGFVVGGFALLDCLWAVFVNSRFVPQCKLTALVVLRNGAYSYSHLESQCIQNSMYLLFLPARLFVF